MQLHFALAIHLETRHCNIINLHVYAVVRRSQQVVTMAFGRTAEEERLATKRLRRRGFNFAGGSHDFNIINFRKKANFY